MTWYCYNILWKAPDESHVAKQAAHMPMTLPIHHRTSRATKARCLYGKIPEEHWSYPTWVTPEAAATARKSMKETGVLYGSRESYHHMCRYFSGFIHKHPLLREYDYYWRMEPDVHYYCELDYDPFLYMKVSSGTQSPYCCRSQGPLCGTSENKADNDWLCSSEGFTSSFPCQDWTGKGHPEAADWLTKYTRIFMN